MERLTSAALRTCEQMTFPGMSAPISSPASADGSTRLSSPGGLPTGPCGPEAAPASRSARRGRGLAKRTPDTSGPSFDASSPSAVLQSSLVSRLLARLEGLGSPEYALTWKHWDMPSGPPICALRAVGHRTSGSGCIGWPTPNAGPQNDTDTRWQERRAECKAKHGNGNGFGMTLSMAAQITAGWPTPKATDSHGDKPHGSGGQGLHTMAGWSTPRATDGSNGGPNQAGGALSHDAARAGWATPTSRDHKDGGSEGTVPVNGLLGRQAWTHGAAALTSTAPMEKRGASRPSLNPVFVCWLMGYGTLWLMCGQSSLRKP